MLRVRGLFVPVRTLALGLSEVLLISAAIYLFALPVEGHLLDQVPRFGVSAEFSLLLAVVTIVTMIAVGLYNHDAFLDYRAMAARIVLVFVIGVPLILAAMFFYGDRIWPDADFNTLNYLKVIVAVFACLISSRLLFLRFADAGAFKRRVVVMGVGARASHIQALAEQRVSSQFIPVAFVAASQDRPMVHGHAHTLDESSGDDELLDFTLRQGASEIVIATDDRRGLPVHRLLQCKVRGIKITEFLTFCERESGLVDLEALRPSWFIFSDGFRTGWAVRTGKRTFDLAASGAMLILTLPLLLLTAAFIKLTDRGPILYSQERVGLFGKTFTLYKFRSMRVDAEENGCPQWAAKQDSRVTPIGSIIRRVRIDELPQLFNVLKGDMSFIGPRPERPYFVEQLAPQIPFYRERHAVKPGITGWAQINHPYGASLEDARQKLAYDLFYVKNHTLLLDLIVFIQTVRVILFNEGAR
jgi:sugar transferase (PEP-CTERM system associated)